MPAAMAATHIDSEYLCDCLNEGGPTGTILTNQNVIGRVIPDCAKGPNRRNRKGHDVLSQTGTRISSMTTLAHYELPLTASSLRHRFALERVPS